MSEPNSVDIVSAREDERRRMARDVHDALGGDLVAIKMALSMLARRLPSDAGLTDQVTHLDRLVDAAIDTMHALAEKTAAKATLEQLVLARVDAFGRHSGIVCHHQITAGDIDAESEVGRALLMILRECLSNVGKHAQAKQVQVRLFTAAGHLQLEVEDDGVGMACEPGPAALGLRGMRERAEELGGEFSAHAIRPHGTLIRVHLPMAK